MDNPESIVWFRYVTPPVVGAVIGYVTNRVAIRMLFRPLNAWYLMGIKIPMTPGVIPAKRKLLAENMGEVVGEHLLTSEELSKGLHKEEFQKQLKAVIHTRLKGFFAKDLDSLGAIIPSQYQLYINLGIMGLSQKTSDHVLEQLRSEQVMQLVEDVVEKQYEYFAEQPLQKFLSKNIRERGYALIEEKLMILLTSDEVTKWIEAFVRDQIYLILRENKALSDILPQSAQELVVTLIERHVPQLLSNVGVLLADERIRENIVDGVCDGVEKFVDSLGSLADMVRNFLSRDVVAERVEAYLDDKEEDIAAWFASKDIQKKVGKLIAERSREILVKPLTEIIEGKDEKLVADLCQSISTQVMRLLGKDDIAVALTRICRSKIEKYLNDNSNSDISVREVANHIFGENVVTQGNGWVKERARLLLQSPEIAEMTKSLLGILFGRLLQKKIGRLDRFIPPGVTESIAEALQKRVLEIVEFETPQLVQSLGIRRIITEKINSLDLMRLERLLLSIMEEQFKYINIFGALLGFVIGCLNLFFIAR